jgi:predicted ATPase
MVERTRERFYAAELHRLRGLFLAQQAAGEEAEIHLMHALSIAHEQQAHGWSLRAATTLARLLVEQGRRTEANDLLAPIYGWFSEGLDTADLKDAKALLEELA